MVEQYTTLLDEVSDPLTVRNFARSSSLSEKEAIRILEDYVQLNGKPLWALYEITGIVDSSGFDCLPAGESIIKHVVVPQSALDDTKKQFSDIFSTCLHSIQRTNPRDTRVYGRSWADNNDLKSKFLIQKESQQEPSVSTADTMKREKVAEPLHGNKEPVEIKNDNVSLPKKKANVSFFAKKSAKKLDEAEIEMNTLSQNKEEKGRKRPKVEVDEPEKRLETPIKKEKTPEIKLNSEFENQNSGEYPSSREQSVEKEKSPPAKRKKSYNMNDENKKTRKRLILADSDEEPMESPLHGMTKAVKINEKQEDRRRTTRIEKVVETYVDEDGYLVSKEVQKAVEFSPEKPSLEKPKVKVITAPVPGAAKTQKKNSTITSFFKKS